MKFLIIFLSYCVFASVPTMEGLFRHPGNPEVTEEVIVLLLEVQEKNGEDVDKDHVAKKLYGKVLFQNEKGNSSSRIFAQYPDSSYANKQVEKVTIIKNIKNKLSEDESFLRKMIISSLEMYTLNTSEYIVSTMKSINEEFKTNAEILNSDKKELFSKYMEFLKNKKEEELKAKKNNLTEDNTDKIQDTEDVVAVVSPLMSEDDEEKKKIDTLIKSSMYTKPSNLKLEKEGENFYWILRLDGILAKFTNEEHILKYLKVNLNDKEYEIIPNDHVVYSGKYKLPKNIMVKFDNKELEINIKSFYTASNKNKSFNKRISEYRDFYKNSMKSKELKAKDSVIDSAENEENKLNLSQLLY